MARRGWGEAYDRLTRLLPEESVRIINEKFAGERISVPAHPREPRASRAKRAVRALTEGMSYRGAAVATEIPLRTLTRDANGK